MLALRRLVGPFRARLFARRFAPAAPAGWFVLAVSVAAFAYLGVFVHRHVSRVPFNDEYANFMFLFGHAGRDPAAYWAQHNEHRIPLPRLVYVAAVRLAGFDFRAPVAVNVVLLGGATAFLLGVVRRLRGRFAYTDAFIPLAVLGTGAWENLLWGFQVQFVLSTVFVLGVLGLVALPGFAASTVRVGAVGGLTVLLPLCGANGAALVPAVGLFLAYTGGRNLLSGDRSLRRPGVMAVAFGATALVVLVAYFHGLQRVDQHPPPKDPVSVAYAAVNFLGLGMGPVTHLVHTPGYDRFTAIGLGVVALVAVTGGLLARSLRDPGLGLQAAGIGCVLVGLLCLTAGLAYGRAGYANIMGASRYITLAMPVLVAAYVAWVATARGPAGRLIPAGLFAAGVLALGPNVWHAGVAGGFHAARLKKVEREVNSGVPIGFIGDGNRYVLYNPPAGLRISLELLRDHGVRPFDAVRPDPALTATAVPVRVLRTEGMTAEAGAFRVDGNLGGLVLALPDRRHVYGLALTYELEMSGPAPVLSVTSWDLDGRAPPAPGCGVTDQLTTTAGPLTTRILVDREINTLRVDLANPGARIRVHSLAVLSRAD